MLAKVSVFSSVFLFIPTHSHTPYLIHGSVIGHQTKLGSFSRNSAICYWMYLFNTLFNLHIILQL